MGAAVAAWRETGGPDTDLTCARKYSHTHICSHRSAQPFLHPQSDTSVCVCKRRHPSALIESETDYAADPDMAQALHPNTCTKAGLPRRPVPPAAFSVAPHTVSPRHRRRPSSHSGRDLVCAATGGAGGSGATAASSLSALAHQVETAPDEVQWNRATVVENRWVLAGAAHVAGLWQGPTLLAVAV